MANFMDCLTQQQWALNAFPHIGNTSHKACQQLHIRNRSHHSAAFMKHKKQSEFTWNELSLLYFFLSHREQLTGKILENSI